MPTTRFPIILFAPIIAVAATVFNLSPAAAELAESRSVQTINLAQTVSTRQPLDPVLEHPDGTLSIGVREPSIRFSFDRHTIPEQQAIHDVIDRSISEGRSATIRYNPHTGQFDAYSFSFVFPICSIGIRDETVDTAAPCLPTADIDEMTPEPFAHDLVARGVGLAEARQFTAARAVLNEAFALEDIEPDIAFIGNRVRGLVLRMLSFDHPPHSLESDAMLVAALPDLRAALSYHAVDSFLAMANVLTGLGAYDEALRIYEALPQTAPLWELERATHIAFIRRLRGDADGALEFLREFEQTSAVGGMKLSFNLGQTLVDLERYDEAIAELSAGLSTQPDFAWGLLLRSCARASAGDIAGALLDARNGHAAFLQYPEEELAAADDSLAEIEERLALLERLAIEAPHTPAAQSCGDEPGESRRGRSPLLENVDLRIDEIVQLERNPPEERDPE